LELIPPSPFQPDELQLTPQGAHPGVNAANRPNELEFLTTGLKPNPGLQESHLTDQLELMASGTNPKPGAQQLTNRPLENRERFNHELGLMAQRAKPKPGVQGPYVPDKLELVTSGANATPGLKRPHRREKLELLSGTDDDSSGTDGDVGHRVGTELSATAAHVESKDDNDLLQMYGVYDVDRHRHSAGIHDQSQRRGADADDDRHVVIFRIDLFVCHSQSAAIALNKCYRYR